MTDNFVEITEVGKLTDLLALSNERPVVVFKHSAACGVSARAYERVAELAVPIMLVVVQSARALSNAIAVQTGIEHESPQAIVFRNGKPVWFGSHSQITAEALRGAIQEHE